MTACAPERSGMVYVIAPYRSVLKIAAGGGVDVICDMSLVALLP